MLKHKGLTITRVVHSCVVIDFAGSAVLTDPWFSEKFGCYFGEPRGMTVEDLPPLSAVVVSHDHQDHNDMVSLARYPDKRVPIVCERHGVKKAHGAGFTNVAALAPWQTIDAGPVRITATPALHGIPGVGYVLQAAGFTVYFAGDTLIIPALAEVARRFPDIDVALLPINGLKVFGKQRVMNAVEAARLCKVLRPRLAIPTQYAFNGGPIADSLYLKYFDEQQQLPIIFYRALKVHAPDTRFELLHPGNALSLSSLRGQAMPVAGAA